MIKNKIKTAMLLLFILLSGAALIVFRDESIKGVSDSLSVCGNILIPSMFPFMVLSSFALSSGVFHKLDGVFSPIMKKVFHLPGVGFSAVFFGFIGGYPVGARMISELYEKGNITKSEAKHLFVFCVNAGPAFIVSAAGSAMLGSAEAGFVMLCGACLSSLITGTASSLFFKKEKHSAVREEREYDLSSALTSAVSSALGGVMNVCAWVMAFSCVSEIIESKISNEKAKLIFDFVSEVTTGVPSAARLGGVPLAAAAISFGGVCVMCQIVPYIKKCGMKISEYLSFRIINAAVTYFITKIILPLASVTVTVYANSPVRAFSYSAPASAALLLLGASLIMTLAENDKSY